MSEELTATLIVDRSRSRCGNCGKGVLPSETHHKDITDWTPVPGGGCGARFVNMRFGYMPTEDDVRRLKAKRPDLPLIDY